MMLRAYLIAATAVVAIVMALAMTWEAGASTASRATLPAPSVLVVTATLTATPRASATPTATTTLTPTASPTHTATATESPTATPVIIIVTATSEPTATAEPNICDGDDAARRAMLYGQVAILMMDDGLYTQDGAAYELRRLASYVASVSPCAAAGEYLSAMADCVYGVGCEAADAAWGEYTR